MFPVIVPRFSSDNNAICYILPVLLMTSRFHIMAPMGQIQTPLCFVEFSRGGNGSDV